jgi:hypothetical protein
MRTHMHTDTHTHFTAHTHTLFTRIHTLTCTELLWVPSEAHPLPAALLEQPGWQQ